MRFTQDPTSSVNVIRGYAAGEFKINESVVRAPLIVSATTIVEAPFSAEVHELGAPHTKAILNLKPELVLLGTGDQQKFPASAFGAQFLSAGIGFEVMNTGAACRTFNVLVSEHRQVVALLLA